MKKWTVLILLLLVFTLLLVGCGKETTVVTDDGTTVTTTDEGDGDVTAVVTDDENGTATYQAGDDLQLPDSWPESDMPLYPGSEIVYSMEYQADGQNSLAVVIGTDDSMDDISAYYEDVMADATNTSSVQINGVYMLNGEKNGMTYSIVTSNDKESDWSGDTNYQTYVMITIYTVE